MNRNKRFMAGAAALVVAAVGVAGLQGLANAYSAATSLPGTLYLNNSASNTTGTTINTFTDTITLAQSPTGNQNAGTVIAVTLSGTTGPRTGPVAVQANTNIVRAKISLTNAGSSTSSVPTATVNLASFNNSTTGAAGTPACTYPATNIAPTTDEGAWATYGQFTATGNGAARLALNSIMFDDQGNGYNFGTVVCTGVLGGNDADYYVSGSGTNGVTNAKTAAADSTVVANDFFITGPNAQVTFVGGTVTGAGSYTRGSGGDVEAATKNTAVGTVNLTGTVWGNSKVSSDFTVELCNSAGSSCDATAVSTNGKVLETSSSGVLTGRIGVIETVNTTGLRAIKITEGANVSLTPITILGAAVASISPTSGGPGTVVALTGNSLPLSRAVVSAQTLNVGVYGLPDGTNGSALCTGFGAPVQSGALQCTAVGPYIRGPINQYVSPLPTTSLSGVLSASPTVLDPATSLVGFAEKTVLCNSSGSSCAPTNTAVDYTKVLGAGAASASFTVNQDQCIAYTGDSTGGAGCFTKQNVNVSVLQGNLTQRVYVNTAAATGTGVATSSATTPVVGTSNVNADATTVNLGTLTTPLAPVVIAGTLNDITVSDNRGGTNGWSLTATGTGFTGVPSGTIAASALTATPSCAGATNSTAWDYSNAGKVAITGFDATLNAGGLTAGSAAQAFGSTVNLCTKSTAVNSTTGSTGGVYNVTSSLSLTVPAFQQAARYTAVITITLA
jgi:hypothetical protein